MRAIHLVSGLILTAALSAAGCARGDATAPKQHEFAPPSGVRETTIINRLDVNVTLTSAAGATVLAPQQSVVLPLPPAGSLQWAPARRVGARGEVLADDIQGGTLSIAGTASTAVNITNILGGVYYITPYVTSSVAGPISLQLVQPTVSRCLGEQAATATPVKWGYYRLDAITELRVHSGSDCSGPYTTWKFAQLMQWEAGTGIVRIDVTSAP
jgi:hypothetical protein